jgi:hypothetical protein
MCASHPQQVGDLLGTVYRLVGDGELPPWSTHPSTCRGGHRDRVLSAADDTGELIGKLILSIPREGRSCVVVPPERARVFRSDGAYIITGAWVGSGCSSPRGWLQRAVAGS